MSSSAAALHDSGTPVFRYDVFVSHAEPDRDWVADWLLPRLEEKGIRACVDYRDFEPGTPKIKAIQEAIETSRSALFIITPAYLADEWNQSESLSSFQAYLGVRRVKPGPIKTSTAFGETLERARRNHRAIPLLLEPCELPPWFDGLVSLDFTVPNRQMAELDRLVRTILSLRSAPSPKPRPKVESGWPDEVIRSMAWEIRYALPNKVYREFVACHLLQLDPGHRLVDPFARELPASAWETAYVERHDVGAELVQWGSQIVAGPVGAGKTALAERLSRSLSPQYLVVRCLLDDRNGAPAHGNDGTSAGAHIGNLIPRRVFDAYIKHLLGSLTGQPSALPRLRRNRDWMEHLRWLNRVFQPAVVAPAADFELLNWLANAPTFQHLPTSEDAFPDLISFLAHPASISGLTGSIRQYEGVLLLLDVPNHLSSHDADEIALLVQSWASLDPKHLSLKLFTSEGSAAEIIRQLDATGPGCLALYRLPPWREDELRELLAKRLLVWTPGEWELDDWAERLPESRLQLAARRKFVSIIVAGALRAYESGRLKEERGPRLDAEMDSSAAAPLHALALARGLVAACAGCLGGGTIANEQPLSIKQLEALVDEYWAIN